MARIAWLVADVAPAGPLDALRWGVLLAAVPAASAVVLFGLWLSHRRARRPPNR